MEIAPKGGGQRLRIRGVVFENNNPVMPDNVGSHALLTRVHEDVEYKVLGMVALNSDGNAYPVGEANTSYRRVLHTSPDGVSRKIFVDFSDDDDDVLRTCPLRIRSLRGPGGDPTGTQIIVVVEAV